MAEEKERGKENTHSGARLINRSQFAHGSQMQGSFSSLQGLERGAVWEGSTSAGGTMAQRRGGAEGEGSLGICATCAQLCGGFTGPCLPGVESCTMTHAVHDHYFHRGCASVQCLNTSTWAPLAASVQYLHTGCTSIQCWIRLHELQSKPASQCSILVHRLQ